MRWRLGVARVSMAVLALLSACDQQNSYQPPPPPAVDVALPIRKPVTRYLEATGYAATVNKVDLVARIQGFLQSINYQDGAVVTRGTPLFTIEPEPYRLKLEQAKAAEAGSRARLLQAEADYKRQVELAARQNVSQATLDQSLAKRDTERSSVREAEVSVGLAKINSDYTQVTAPFDGLVTAHQVSVGELVGNGPTTLATIVQLDPIYVNFTISEQDVLRVRASMRKAGIAEGDLKNVPVEVGLQDEAGYPHKGTLDYAAPIVEQATGTLAVRALLPNPGRALLPGNFVRVRIPSREANDALLVPVASIGSGQGGRYVLVVNDKDVVEQRNVELGPVTDGLQVVDRGLTPADRVVVGGIMQAIPGQKVVPQMPAAAAAAALSVAK